jgi:hypothetical protein
MCLMCVFGVLTIITVSHACQIKIFKLRRLLNGFFFCLFKNLAVRQLAVLSSPDETDKPTLWYHDNQTSSCTQGDSPHVSTVGVVIICTSSFQSRQCVSTRRTILTPNDSYVLVLASLNGLYSGSEMCFLWGTNWICIYIRLFQSSDC